MDLPPINTINGADARIIAELMSIRRATHWRPCFRRGRMFFDFNSGKVCIAEPDHVRAR